MNTVDLLKEVIADNNMIVITLLTIAGLIGMFCIVIGCITVLLERIPGDPPSATDIIIIRGLMACIILAWIAANIGVIGWWWDGLKII